MENSNSEIVCPPSQEIGYYLNIQSSSSSFEDISLDGCTTFTRSLFTTSTINKKVKHMEKGISKERLKLRVFFSFLFQMFIIVSIWEKEW